ncbi:MAG TPA: SIMPL domain-containing protein [Allosphingosinicella sp.]|jgi:hypothetical protein
MRKLVVAAWLAVSSIVAAVPAAADSPISLPPLAPGEVLAEVTGIGVSTNAATSATLAGTVTTTGQNDAEARRALDEAIRRVTAAARAAGVASADIDLGQPQVSSDEYDLGMNLSVAEFNTGDIDVDAPAETLTRYGRSTLSIRVRNAAAAARLKDALNAVEHVTVHSVEYALDDDSAARRDARADAVRRARADAESYAASMNMRVARVLRVTERVGSSFTGALLSGNSALQRELEGRETDPGDGTIRTYALVGVDYALAPR